MTGFAAGERRWRDGLGSVRQVVRQELVARQLAAHVPDSPPLRVLDVGCGQGTQLLRLARRGHHVTGLDTSTALLGDLADALAADPPRGRVRVVEGDARHLDPLFPAGSFDLVLCHGVLMYFADPEPLLAGLARVVGDGGVLSLLVRNGDALAMRPGLLGDWATALRAFDETTYDNRIGVPARADRFDALAASLDRLGLAVRAWYGVRVFTDNAPTDAEPPGDLAALLDCEERAGATDPYRRVAALTHVIADRKRL
ncbi:class I SAM-dependent methyltransferase [Saccharothrix coeruleofusca]|uniref:Methyltransferase n=1 Tax=Saccharothrix coeruleofusca TaxID=33919 RepID=A0A918AS30_9PSEU|nr:class I SAM-dependent methyltransferase [Saccharothrix coeruleofusca]MBP2335456.1 SAM-dependent methyltransferase [Saccharothrix coeruleofusca]GGP77886.1 methyltransferase [Saccharothrix coeruleofusca]